MKKILIFLFLLLFHPAFAGTGGARDTALLYLLVIAFLAVILSALYSVSFVKKMLINRKHHENTQHTNTADDANQGGFV